MKNILLFTLLIYFFIFLTFTYEDERKTHIFSQEDKIKNLKTKEDKVQLEEVNNQIEPEEKNKKKLKKYRVSKYEKNIINKIKKLKKNKKYEEAIEISETQLKSKYNTKGMEKWLRSFIANTYYRMGLNNQKIKKWETANSYFKKSIKIIDDVFPFLYGRIGYTSYKIQDFDACITFLEEYLKSKPEDIKATNILSKCYEKNRDFEKALEIKNQLLYHDDSDYHPSEDDFASLEQQIITDYQQDSLSSNHFTLYYEHTFQENFAEQVFSILEESLKELIDDYGFSYPLRNIETIIYNNEDYDVIRFKDPDWASGIYDGRIHIPFHPKLLVNRKKKLRRVLKHEIVHALFADIEKSKRLPYWFEEGLAQRASCYTNACKEFPLPKKINEFLSHKDLNSKFIRLDKKKARDAYRQSFFLVRVIELTKGKNSLQDIIKHIYLKPPNNNNELLKPISLNFNELVKITKDYWYRTTELPKFP